LQGLAQKTFSLPASILDKSKACFRRLQNSSAVGCWRTQTIVIADLEFILSLSKDFAKIYQPKRFQWPLKWISFGQQVVSVYRL
jgi:hypothetical protein